MATDLFLRDAAADDVTADDDRMLSPIRGAAPIIYIKNTVAGPVTPPTAATQWTKSAGGAVISWVSDPVNAFTLGAAGAPSASVRAFESATAANATIAVEVGILSGGVFTSLSVAGLSGLELGTSEATVSRTFTNPNRAFAAGDRIVFRCYVDDASGVTMASGRTCSLSIDGPTGGSSGDSFLHILDTVTFQSAATTARPKQTVVTQAIARAATRCQKLTQRKSGIFVPVEWRERISVPSERDWALA